MKRLDFSATHKRRNANTPRFSILNSQFSILILVLAAALLPLTALAAPALGSWQVYSIGSGLRELQSYSIAPDGAGGVWAGHQSGGRGIYRAGGLSHIRADGSSQTYGGDEPFRSCSSVDALALAPDGTLWMRLSGYHDYGASDHGQQCGKNYGVSDESGRFSFAIGAIGADGVPRMLPKEQLPPGVMFGPNSYTWGFAADALGRPWIGTQNGAAVREADGTWREVVLWSGQPSRTVALRAANQGRLIVAGASDGSVATFALLDGQPDLVGLLPRPLADTSVPVSDVAAGPGGAAAILGRQLFRQNQAGGWDAFSIPVPAQFGEQPLYGQQVAFAGGTFWVGAPYYGLQRLDPNGWTAFSAEQTPLPSNAIYGLAADGDTALLMATDRGAARLDTSGPAPDPSAARRAFDGLWQRTNVNAQGTWVWGPRAWAERYEAYREGPGGYRFVRYYDKTRMEVSNPQADPNSPWYITNGLLVVELVRGQAQTSDDPARSACPFFVTGNACPSGVPVAGDLNLGASQDNQAPGYGQFEPFLAGVDQRAGARVSATLERQQYGDVKAGENAALATAATTVEYFDTTTRHNVPRVFWNYMRAQPADWLYAFGHPITEAYWVRARIRGVDQWVMVQLFERRTLTYTPGNAPEWQVEMGNVGQHYFAWRYGVYENPPWAR